MKTWREKAAAAALVAVVAATAWLFVLWYAARHQADPPRISPTAPP